MAGIGAGVFSVDILPLIRRRSNKSRPIPNSKLSVSASVVPTEKQGAPSASVKGVVEKKSTAYTLSSIRRGGECETKSKDGQLTLKDYFEQCTELISRSDGGPPRWFSPLSCGSRSKDSPVLLNLPGVDGVGLGLLLHHERLGKIFDIRCLHIPLADRTSFTDLVKLVESTVRSECSRNPNRPIYLVGESFGGCLVLAVAARNPDIDLVLILANPATSFTKSGSQLQALVPLSTMMPEQLSSSLPYLLTLLTDDIVLIEETKVGVQRKLELWRDTLEARGFRLSRSKTEYMECRFSDNSDREAGMITFDGKVVHGSAFFRYLGSIIQKDGELDGDVAHRIKAGWLKWKSATGVLCDPGMPHRLKGKFYRTAIRPALLYGTECWAVKQCHVQKMNVAEMRMLRWMCGHTKKDRLRNEVIREKVRVASIEDKMMENRLRWFGHARRRPIDAPMRRLESWGTSNIVKGRGRPKKTWIKLIENDMRFLGIGESMAMERQIWRERIRVVDES
ncbi:hypothetical protein OROHE_021683 [Orobanche hederae]